ncbi:MULTISPECIES: hypothetical protein [Winogradskyella]|uniref:hypothetical protein n=1 Tax=Winogradskyella TaxID=286104 RepID=UPI0015CBF489|nr:MULTISPECIES: hypothetical protein [Winogradskyella]QXP78943.1 hypothetical protein H0I32_17350 [Winogradskyella sp. HaHa_3_26]
MNYIPQENHRPYKTYTLKVGKLFLYEDFIITEFNEGVELNFESFNEVAEIILLTYRDRPFGFIANKTNPYSIKLKDAFTCNKAYKNLKAYAIITYSEVTEDIIEIEDQFFNFNRKVFYDFENAINWIEKTIEKEKSTFVL